MSAAETAAFCCNCKEDFPVGNGVRIQMGQLTPLAAIRNKRIRDRFASWADDDEGGYLCGNCYFDLTDDEL